MRGAAKTIFVLVQVDAHDLEPMLGYGRVHGGHDQALVQVFVPECALVHGLVQGRWRLQVQDQVHGLDYGRIQVRASGPAPAQSLVRDQDIGLELVQVPVLGQARDPELDRELGLGPAQDAGHDDRDKVVVECGHQTQYSPLATTVLMAMNRSLSCFVNLSQDSISSKAMALPMPMSLIMLAGKPRSMSADPSQNKHACSIQYSSMRLVTSGYMSSILIQSMVKALYTSMGVNLFEDKVLAKSATVYEFDSEGLILT